MDVERLARFLCVLVKELEEIVMRVVQRSQRSQNWYWDLLNLVI